MALQNTCCVGVGEEEKSMLCVCVCVWYALADRERVSLQKFLFVCAHVCVCVCVCVRALCVYGVRDQVQNVWCRRTRVVCEREKERESACLNVCIVRVGRQKTCGASEYVWCFQKKAADVLKQSHTRRHILTKYYLGSIHVSIIHTRTHIRGHTPIDIHYLSAIHVCKRTSKQTVFRARG